MVSDFNWSNYLSFEFFLRTRWVDILFDFFNCYFSSSPFSFEHLWGISIAYFFFEDEATKLDNVLFGIPLNLFNYKFSQINQIVLFVGLFLAFLFWNFIRTQFYWFVTLSFSLLGFLLLFFFKHNYQILFFCLRLNWRSDYFRFLSLIWFLFLVLA